MAARASSQILGRAPWRTKLAVVRVPRTCTNPTTRYARDVRHGAGVEPSRPGFVGEGPGNPENWAALEGFCCAIDAPQSTTCWGFVGAPASSCIVAKLRTSTPPQFICCRLAIERCDVPFANDWAVLQTNRVQTAHVDLLLSAPVHYLTIPPPAPPRSPAGNRP